MCGGETVIENCPKISDTYASSRILTHLGLQCIIEKNVMTVRNNGNKTVEIPDDLMREMRSSIIYMGALLGACGECRMSFSRRLRARAKTDRYAYCRNEKTRRQSG